MKICSPISSKNLITLGISAQGGGSQVWNKYNAGGTLIQSVNQTGVFAVIGNDMYIQPGSAGTANLHLKVC